MDNSACLQSCNVSVEKLNTLGMSERKWLVKGCALKAVATEEPAPFFEEHIAFILPSSKRSSCSSSSSRRPALANVTNRQQSSSSLFKVLRIPTQPRAMAIDVDSKNVKVFKRFVGEGKATLSFSSPINLQVLISRADPYELMKFLKFIRSSQSSSTSSSSSSASRKKRSRSSRDEFDFYRNNNFNFEHPSKRARGESSHKSASRSTSRAPSKSRDGISISRYDKSSKSSKNSDGIRVKMLDEFSEDQKRALNLILQGRNIFMTGSAGSGKSFLLRHIISSLPKKSTQATACTGVAASHIDGSTIYHLASLGRGDATPEQSAKRIRLNEESFKMWMRMRLLIIDEVSMLDGNVFQKLEKICRLVRASSKPFGGIQLLLCGDFFQLPPVGEPKHFCFESEAWARGIHETVELRKIFRQSNNEFIKVLEQLRIGRLTNEGFKILSQAFHRKFPDDGIAPTMLMTHKRQVDQMNQQELAKLPGEVVTFKAKDTAASDFYLRNLKASCTARDVLPLKVGSQVVLLKNLSVAKKFVNGSRGVVVAFSKSFPRVPIVKFANGSKLKITPEEWSVKIGSTVFATRSQIPLDLAWAMSIHKSQGMSLDRVTVSLRKAFEPGQVYVALSRARSLESLSIRSIDIKMIRAHPKVIEFYRKLQKEKSSPS